MCNVDGTPSAEIAFLVNEYVESNWVSKIQPIVSVAWDHVIFHHYFSASSHIASLFWFSLFNCIKQRQGPHSK